MVRLFNKVLKHITTGIDGESYDMAKIAGLFTVIMLNGFTFYNMAVLHNNFEVLSYAGGSASVITGTCIGVLFKKDTEPRN